MFGLDMGGCRHEGSCVWVRVVGVLVQELAQVALRLEGPLDWHARNSQMGPSDVTTLKI